MTKAPTKFTRRILLSSVTAAAVGAVALYAGNKYSQGTSVRQYLRTVYHRVRDQATGVLPPAERLAQYFPYLQLDDASVKQFVADYEKHHGRITSDREFGEKFLLSSNFFINGADEGKPVRYVTYYDAHVSPCWSPFPA